MATSVTITQAEKDYATAYTQISTISKSIAAERQRGNVAGVAAMLVLYKFWSAKFKDAAQRLGKSDFTSIDRVILSTGQYLADAAAALPDTTGALAAGVGKGLLKGALPFIALAGIIIYLKGKF